MADLEGKLALVTGGQGGMGEVICMALATQGADVAIVDVVDPEKDKVSGKIEAQGQAARYYRSDISNGDDVRNLFSKIDADFGRVDVLVNLAGLVGRRDASIIDPEKERDFYMEEPFEEWLQVMKVNVWGANQMVRHAVSLMRQGGGGSIVNLSSLAGRFGAAAAALSYTASKSALVGLSKQWAKMYGRDGIRSNAIAPGPTNTPMLDSMSDVKKEAFKNATLTGRISEPADIATAVCFLAGPGSGNITGQVLEINGGCWIPA